jgi:transcriptional regulator with XRE-family HTH domain
VDEGLPVRRYRLLLRQFADEFGDGWQTELAHRLRLDPSAIQKQHAGERAPSRKTIQLAIEIFKLDANFFYDTQLGEAPQFRDFLRTSGPAAPVLASPADNPHWRKFVSLRLHEQLGLTPAETAWVREAPLRGGPTSMDDYVTVAEALLRKPGHGMP